METRESITQEASNKEVWKSAPGWEGFYEVSDMGRVRSLDRVDSRGHRRKGRTLKPATDKRGYRKVILSRGGKATDHSVHRLVVETFIGPIPEGMHVDHIDNDPTNNRLDNLQTITPKENNARKKLFGTSMADRVANGTHHHTRKTECPNSHPHFSDNNLPSREKRGARECLICKRAKDYLRIRPDFPGSMEWAVFDMYAERLLLDLESAEKV